MTSPIKLSTALILALSMMAVSSAAAQDSTATGWKISLVLDMTATQTAYSDSWTGGEAGNLSWVANLNGSAEKQLTPSFNFKSRLKLSFGQTHTQTIIVDEFGNEEKVWQKPKKSTDLIDWENVGRLTKGWAVDPYLAFRLESQFLDASVPGHDRYFSPLKLTESGGISRKIYERDKDQIISRLGFAVRQIFIKGLQDTLVESQPTYIREDSSLSDGGMEWVTDASLTFHKNIQYTGKLTLYKAFFSSSKENRADLEKLPEPGRSERLKRIDYWKAVDVNWENIVSAKITKIITVNFYLQFLYDKEVEVRGRLKETLGIGFVFQMI